MATKLVPALAMSLASGLRAYTTSGALRASSGWTTFAKEKYTQFEEQVKQADGVAHSPPPKNVMKRLGEAWKALSEVERAPYRAKAKAQALSGPRAKDQELKELKGSLYITGYQLFIKEQLTGQKAAQQEGAVPALSDAASEWSKLPQTSKDSYSTKAKSIRNHAFSKVAAVWYTSA